MNWFKQQAFFIRLILGTNSKLQHQNYCTCKSYLPRILFPYWYCHYHFITLYACSKFSVFIPKPQYISRQWSKIFIFLAGVHFFSLLSVPLVIHDFYLMINLAASCKKSFGNWCLRRTHWYHWYIHTRDMALFYDCG